MPASPLTSGKRVECPWRGISYAARRSRPPFLHSPPTRPQRPSRRGSGSPLVGEVERGRAEGVIDSLTRALVGLGPQVCIVIEGGGRTRVAHAHLHHLDLWRAPGTVGATSPSFACSRLPLHCPSPQPVRKASVSSRLVPTRGRAFPLVIRPQPGGPYAGNARLRIPGVSADSSPHRPSEAPQG
jgi:hypothetical protein